MQKIPFQDIPHKYTAVLNEILNEKTKIGNKLKKLYSQFSFKYLNFPLACENSDKINIGCLLLNHFIKFKFITYFRHIVKSKNSQPNNDIFQNSKEKNHTFSPNLKPIKVNIIFCVEGQCIIIDKIDLIIIDFIIKILKREKSSLINVRTNVKLSVKEEIKIFCDSYLRDFKLEIKKDKFIRTTIRPIVGYLIRRYFYPTDYFSNPSFFDFREVVKKNERESKAELINLIKTGQFCEEDLERIKSSINVKREIRNFKEEEFIVLRTITSNEKAIFHLVIHIESLYIFMMKKIGAHKSMTKEEEHEIYFDENFSHRCFTPFYGFIKENDKTIGFLYEYMCNDTLKSYVSSNRDKIDETFVMSSICRIIQGIDYLHSSKLVHRDLKPLNILIDHDFLPYISDFDSIRHPEEVEEENSSEPMTNDICPIAYSSPELFKGENVSFPSDIYQFGLIIYYLYEKKDLYSSNGAIDYIMKEDEIPTLNKAENSIQALFKKCLKFIANERISNQEIKMIYNDEIFPCIYQHFFFSELKSDIEQLIYESLIISNNLIQYKENIFIYKNFLYEIAIDYNKATEYYELSAKQNNSVTLNNLEYLYENGYGVKQDYNRAKEYYELSSKQNNSVALNYLGDLYYYGYGVKQDCNKEKEYYELSAQQNNSYALNNLGNLYKNGYGVKQDYNQAKEYYELSAQQNNSYALNNLGHLYKNGYGVKQDYNKAKEYYELSAQQNNSNALIYLGNLYKNGYGVKQDYNQAKEYYELSAKQNNSKAFLYLGNLYYFGYGVKQDYNQAKEYYELSAQQNNSYALNNLGHLYKNGYGVKQDYNQAKEYYELSAKQNNSKAFLYLGNLYYFGYGVKQDYNKAKEYYESSAKQNNSKAFLKLGNLYYFGYGVKQDYNKAKDYYEISAKQNNSKAFLYLGNLYYFGYGVKQDYNQAKEYYELSAQQNNSYALNNLGHLYKNGYGVKQDYNQAKEYYELSAKQNNSKAFLYLGNLYYFGYGVKQDYNQAKEYYELSAKQNNSKAFLYLGRLYYYGYGEKLDYDKAKEYFELSAKHNNLLALFYLGNLYKNTKDYLKAINHYELSAQKNNSDSLCKIGNLYLKGRGFEKNYLKAKEFYEQSADRNNPNALYKLGKLYYNGQGVKQDYMKAKEYYELSGRQGNSKALFELGKLYFEGKGVKQDYNKAKKYYEMSTYNNNPDGLFFLGIFYSRGDIFEINIHIAFQYFMKSIKFHFDQVRIYNNVDHFYDTKNIYNNYYYHSHNDLGLIYLTVHNDIENCTKHIKEATFGEYPFGQNNFGLLNEIYFNEIGNAEYMYQRSSKHNFALAYYNFGHLKEKTKRKEKENKKENQESEEYIEYYKRASDTEDYPLIFHNRQYYDKRLEISKTFIICMTNLKLCEYYLNENDNEESKKYFARSLRKLLNKEEHSMFKVKIDVKNAESFFIYLKDFILSFPLFNLSNQPNLNINIGNDDNQKENHDISSSSEKSFSEENIEEKCSTEVNDKKLIVNQEMIEKINERKNQENEGIKKEYKSKDEQISEYGCDSVNPRKEEISADEEEIIFKDVNEIFEFIVSKEQYKNIFCEEINKIIQIMNDIIYTPPYPILFGRISISKLKPKEEINPNQKEINELFYEGLGLEEFKYRKQP